MGIFDRYKSKKEKKEAVSPAIVESEAVEEMPSEELSVTEINTPSPLDNSAIVEKETGQQAKPASVAPVSATPTWVHAGSFEEAAKIDPKITRSDYIYKRGKYLREQGLPDMDLAELNKILGGKDPYETEEQRLKREKNMRVAKNINALGTFLNALVNYNRVKRGHVGYTPDKGTETYNRLERIRTGQEQLAQSRAKDYLGAMAKDRAERAKAEALAVSARQAERNYQLKVAELEWKMANAKTEAERKQAEYERKVLESDRNFKEKQRSNRANEAIRRERAAKTGGGTKKYLELQTGSGVKQYTPEEYGNNWVHKAYQDMLKEPGGKKFAVHKHGGYFGGSTVPSEQEMYEAITRYNDSQWKNRYKSNRYGGQGNGNPPLE